MTERHLFESVLNRGTRSARSLCGDYFHRGDPLHLTRDQDPATPLCPACAAVQGERREKNRKLGLYEEER